MGDDGRRSEVKDGTTDEEWGSLAVGRAVDNGCGGCYDVLDAPVHDALEMLALVESHWENT